jgi:hypothetical protein
MNDCEQIIQQEMFYDLSEPAADWSVSPPPSQLCYECLLIKIPRNFF